MQRLRRTWSVYPLTSSLRGVRLPALLQRKRAGRSPSSSPVGISLLWVLFPDLPTQAMPTNINLWVADITCIAIATGFVYLAAILDAWSRRIVGYAIGKRIEGWRLPHSGPPSRHADRRNGSANQAADTGSM
jgi:transposase InsO family protein